MARLARVVVPGVAHHITQRGNRRQQTFFGDEDYRLYLELMAEWCARQEVAVWAYCLMPNHVHLIAVPERADGLARALGEAHRRYTREINRRQEWTGYLRQGRFASFPLEGAHLRGRDDRLVRTVPLREMAGGAWRSFLAGGLGAGELELIESHLGSGRPLGDEDLVAGLERRLGRPLRKRKPGRKPKPAGDLSR